MKLTATHDTDSRFECQQLKEAYQQAYPGSRFRVRVRDNAQDGQQLLPGFKRYTCIITEI